MNTFKRILIVLSVVVGVLFATVPANASTAPSYPTVTSVHTVFKFRHHNNGPQVRRCMVVTFVSPAFKVTECGRWHRLWWSWA